MTKIKDYIKPAIGDIPLNKLHAHNVQTMVNDNDGEKIIAQEHP